MLIATILINLFLGIWLTSCYRTLQQLSKGKIRKLDNKPLAEKAEKWFEQKESYLILIRSTTLLNISCFTLMVYKLLADESMALSYIIALFILSIALYVILTESFSGWMIKHLWGLLKVSMPVFQVLSYPFMLVVVPAKFFQSELISESEDEEERPTTVEEIEALLEDEVHDKSDDIDDASLVESKMIRGVLDLDETPVKEIMTPRVDITAIPITESVENAKQTIISSGHSRIPVFKESIDDIVGIIYSKDLLIHKMTPESNLEYLMHKPIYIPESKNVRDLLKEIKQTQRHIAVVIDECGGTSGVVSLEDILEEIVGEITDEFDVDEEELFCQVDNDGSLTIDARTTVDSVNEQLDISLKQEEDSVTIGGFLTSQLGRIPLKTEEHIIDDVKFLVVDADERKIIRLKITKMNVIESSKE